MPKLSIRPRLAVIWIDWYPYHVARMRGLLSEPSLAGRAVGIELVGGIGVHAGLKFREDLPADLPVQTLLPDTSWREAKKLTLTRLLWSRLSELDPDAVLVPGYYTLPAIAAALWARLHGRTSILMTESTAGDHRRTCWKEAIKSLGLHLLFDRAVAGGREHIAYLRQLGFPDDRISGKYDVVDNDFFREGTSRLRLHPSKDFHLPQDYFLYVGRLAEEKNVGALLSSWLTYRDEGGAWPLVLVGDGPEAASLREWAAATPYTADILFAGLRSSSELLPFYAFAGCFVLPSTREPWGLVVNEAMAAGLPVLVSDRCGCASDLVEPGMNGFLFKPDDTTALTSLMHRMESLAPEQRSRFRDAAYRRIRSFSPASFGRSVASLIQAADDNAVDRHAVQSLVGDRN